MVNDIKLYKSIQYVLLGSFAAFTLWWLFLISFFADASADNDWTHLFGSTYALVALIGGAYGLYAAKPWGYFKSHLGKATIFLSLGLLMNVFGQIMFSYYNYIEGIDVPYPSLADVGYFGAIPCYILGAIFLARGLGVRSIVTKNKFKLLLGIVVPLVILGASYWLFLGEYVIADQDALTLLLDFGYPLGQAAYVSIAFVILLTLGRLIGGAMKMPILLLLTAFIIQYLADFNFLYQASQGTWIPSGTSYGDYIYLLAYFVMGLSLTSLSHGLHKIYLKNSLSKKAK